MDQQELDNLQLNEKLIESYQNAPDTRVNRYKPVRFKTAMISVVGDLRDAQGRVTSNVHFESSQLGKYTHLENAKLVLRGDWDRSLPTYVPVADLSEKTVMTLLAGEVDRYLTTFQNDGYAYDAGDAFRGCFGLTTSLAHGDKKPSLEMLKFLVEQMGRGNVIEQADLDAGYGEQRQYDNVFGGMRILAKAAGYDQAYELTKHLKAEKGDESAISTTDLCVTINQAIAARDAKIAANMEQAIQDPSWEK